MSNESVAVTKWRKRTKERIVQAFGGKCGICGYSRCQDALDLHHLDPIQKDFSFGKIRANPKAWEKIVNELRKCVLICCICHRECHAGMQTIPSDIIRFNEEFSDYKEVERQDRKSQMIDACPICGEEKLISNKTCSYECAGKKAWKVKWNDFDLYDLYVVKKTPKIKIAEIVGCSQHAVRKRLKKLNFNSSLAQW